MFNNSQTSVVHGDRQRQPSTSTDEQNVASQGIYIALKRLV